MTSSRGGVWQRWKPRILDDAICERSIYSFRINFVTSFYSKQSFSIPRRWGVWFPRQSYCYLLKTMDLFNSRRPRTSLFLQILCVESPGRMNIMNMNNEITKYMVNSDRAIIRNVVLRIYSAYLNCCDIMDYSQCNYLYILTLHFILSD